jgi:hypothetical protein
MILTAWTLSLLAVYPKQIAIALLRGTCFHSSRVTDYFTGIKPNAI